MKKIVLLLCVSFTLASLADTQLEVKAVDAHQRYPWNGLVDVIVTIQGVADDVATAKYVFVATNNATKEAIPIEHITCNGSDTCMENVWTRHYVWDAKADVGAVKIDDVALTVDAKIAGVQLWENGPYWAECNVGATKPEECGCYFWWGDTIGYKRNAADNGWVSAKDGTTPISFSTVSPANSTYSKDNDALQSEGWIDESGNLVAAHDAATAYLGAPWRMPTDAEFSALINNCTTTWVTRNGVSGRLVTGKGVYASKSIFLPAVGVGIDSDLSGLGFYGYYWSSTPTSGYSYYSWDLVFGDSIGFINRTNRNRNLGPSVRPVRGYSK